MCDQVLARDADRCLYAVVLTELFGVRLEIATSFAIVAWVLTFVAIVPIGLLLALKKGLDWRGLRRVGREISS